MRFEVCVHVPFAAQAAGVRRKVDITDKTTFRELRSLLLGAAANDACFHRLEIQYSSSFLRRKPAHVPNLDDYVERALSRIQIEWADAVRLVMIDMSRYGGRSGSSGSSSGVQASAASPSLSRFFRSQSASPTVSDAEWPPSSCSSTPPAPSSSSSSAFSSSPPTSSSVYLPNSLSSRFFRQPTAASPDVVPSRSFEMCTEWIHDRSYTTNSSNNSTATTFPTASTTSDGSVDGSSATTITSSSSNSSSSSAQSTSTTSTHPAMEQLKLSKEGTPESIHRDVSCRSFKQGRLFKQTSSGAPPPEAGSFHLLKQQEEWTEMCVILDSTRLWYYPLLSTGGGRFASQMTSIVLEMAATSSVDTKVQFTDTSLSCTTFCITHPRPTPLCVGSGKAYFRAKSRIEAEQWVLAIAAKALHERENDAIICAESLMADMERAASRADVQLLSDNARFEGMLGSALLRGAFRAHLESNHIPESLMFWEHAEDYRRGHPESSEPFMFAGIATSDPGKEELASSLDVQAWGVAIFDTFLKVDAQYQISDCSFEESKQILEVLSAHRCPPHTTFLSVQASAYFKLKYTDGHYPTFITECRQYGKLLRASLHAHHRTLCGLPLMESFLAAAAASSASNGFSTNGAGRAWCRLKSLFSPSSSSDSGNSNSSSSSSLPSERDDDGLKCSGAPAAFPERAGRNSGPGKSRRHTPWRSTKKGSGGLEGNLPDWWWEHACPIEDKDRGSAILTRGCLKTLRGHIPLDEQNTDLLTLLDGNLQAARAAVATATTTFQGCEVDVMAPLAKAQGLGNIILAGLVKARHFHFDTDGVSGGAGGGGAGGVVGGGGGSQQGGFTGGSADPTTGSDWMQLYALVTEFIGRGDVLLYDPVSGTFKVKIHLHRVERVCATPRGLACLDLCEASGAPGGGGSRLRWQIIPLAADWEERRFLTQSWIDTIWHFSAHGGSGGGRGRGGSRVSSTPLRSSSVQSIVRVVKSGFLSKRGNLNTAYQRRWFVCCSDKTLSYYKDSTWKGTIDLGEMDALGYVAPDGSSSAFSRRGSSFLFSPGGGASPLQNQNLDSTIARSRTSTMDSTAAVASGSQREAALPPSSRELTLVTKKRTYFFLADSAEDAERWLQAMHEALQGQVSSPPRISSPTSLAATPPSELANAPDAPYRYIAAVNLTDTNHTLTDEPSPRFSMHR